MKTALGQKPKPLSPNDNLLSAASDMVALAKQNEKGPAATAIAPDRGSTIPGKEKEMNKTNDSTGPESAPVPKTKPTDREILDALDGFLADVQQLRRAALVLDEYANNEFRSAKISGLSFPFPYGVCKEQVEGITYMTDHVRYLALGLENSIDKAFGLEVQS